MLFKFSIQQIDFTGFKNLKPFIDNNLTETEALDAVRVDIGKTSSYHQTSCQETVYDA